MYIIYLVSRLRRHGSKYFLYTNSYNPYNNSIWYFIPFSFERDSCL